MLPVQIHDLKHNKLNFVSFCVFRPIVITDSGRR
jgi:hypothetical protein